MIPVRFRFPHPGTARVGSPSGVVTVIDGEALVPEATLIAWQSAGFAVDAVIPESKDSTPSETGRKRAARAKG